MSFNLNQIMSKGFYLTGGGLTANSINSAHIINGSIATVDLGDGIITEAKFHPTLQATLGGFADALYDLQHPGYYGRLRIKNHNSSVSSITIDEIFYYSRTGQVTLHGSLTLNHNQHHDINIPIGERLTNDDTQIYLRFASLPNVTFSGTGFTDETTEDEDITFKIEPAFIDGVDVEFIIRVI